MGEATIIAAGILLTLALVFVLLRSYSRFVITKSFGADDLCVIFGYLAAVALTYCLVRGRTFVTHQKDEELNEIDIAELVKSLWGVVICFCVGSTLVKNSAILQCLRFILLGKMRIFCFICLVIFTIFGTVATLLTIFHCKPISAYWELNIPEGTCLNLVGFWYFASLGIILTDIIVVVIPIITIKGLNVPFRQKLALMIVFVLGGFGCIASIVRVHYLVVLGTSQNVARVNAQASIWASIELNIGVICVCIPPMKAIVARFAPSLLCTRSDDNAASSQLSGETLAMRTPHRQRKDTLAFLEETEHP